MSDHILVDFDCTLAYYQKGDYKKYGPYHLRAPIPKMVERVKKWLAEGKIVKIFTARVADDDDKDLGLMYKVLYEWSEKHIGQRLDVTCIKDGYAKEIWDDKAIQVIPNMGLSLNEYNQDAMTTGLVNAMNRAFE